MSARPGTRHSRRCPRAPQARRAVNSLRAARLTIISRRRYPSGRRGRSDDCTPLRSLHLERVSCIPSKAARGQGDSPEVHLAVRIPYRSQGISCLFGEDRVRNIIDMTCPVRMTHGPYQRCTQPLERMSNVACVRHVFGISSKRSVSGPRRVTSWPDSLRRGPGLTRHPVDNPPT